MHISAFASFVYRYHCSYLTTYFLKTLTFENQHISQVNPVHLRPKRIEPRVQWMNLAQLLQTIIAVGIASSLMFRSFAGSIPTSDTLFH